VPCARILVGSAPLGRGRLNAHISLRDLPLNNFEGRGSSVAAGSGETDAETINEGESAVPFATCVGRGALWRGGVYIRTPYTPLEGEDGGGKFHGASGERGAGAVRLKEYPPKQTCNRRGYSWERTTLLWNKV